MHKTGHWGVALLLWAPVGALLVLAGFETAAIVGGAGMVVLAMLPDIDHYVPLLAHRGGTHTVGFALLVGIAVAIGLVGFADGHAAPNDVTLGAFGFLVGFLSVVSHLLGDVLTPAGIAPFWPFSDSRYSLELWYANNRVANYTLFALGSAATGVVYSTIADPAAVGLYEVLFL